MKHLNKRLSYIYYWNYFIVPLNPDKGHHILWGTIYFVSFIVVLRPEYSWHWFMQRSEHWLQQPFCFGTLPSVGKAL